MPDRVKVMYHAQCFDGFASAALFSRFYREVVDGDARFVFHGMRHGGPDPVPPDQFDSDIHCVVDFRYSPDDRLDWWFDHHLSAFVSESDRRHFELSERPGHFWDPTAPSCAGFLVRTCVAEYGFHPDAVTDLVEWADRIDAARYPDARTAVALEAPAMQLMSVIEHLKDGPLADDVLRAMADGDLQGIATSRRVQRQFAPILRRQAEAMELVRRVAEVRGDVVLVDISRRDHVVLNKFAPYYLFPDCTYAVLATFSGGRAKVSVGSNPWQADSRRHDISRICEAFGGGGHAVVGGISVASGTPDQATSLAHAVVEKLLVPEEPPEAAPEDITRG